MMESNFQKAMDELPDDFEHLLKFSNQKLHWVLRYGTVLISLLLLVAAACFYCWTKF